MSSGTEAPAEVLETTPFSRDLVASVVGPGALVDGPDLNEAIGYVVGVDPLEFVGLHRAHIMQWLRAAEWLIELFPELEPMRRAPHNLPGAQAFLATLNLPEVYLVPQHPEAKTWLPPVTS